MSIVRTFTVIHNRSSEPIKKIAGNFTRLFEKLWEDERIMQDDILSIEVTINVISPEEYAELSNEL